MTITCICCPKGCQLAVTMEGSHIANITGNQCARGVQYANTECVNPQRMVTTVIPIDGGVYEMVSVKTSTTVPKDTTMACVQALRGLRATAPVCIGTVILQNVCGTGADIIATRDVPLRNREG